jgi:hypothetical protein
VVRVVASSPRGGSRNGGSRNGGSRCPGLAETASWGVVALPRAVQWGCDVGWRACGARRQQTTAAATRGGIPCIPAGTPAMRLTPCCCVDCHLSCPRHTAGHEATASGRLRRCVRRGPCPAARPAAAAAAWRRLGSAAGGRHPQQGTCGTRAGAHSSSVGVLQPGCLPQQT